MTSQAADHSEDPSRLAPMRWLTHPSMLAAIALLALNDHLLRKIWPSALTGKIGDFCWLFFFPPLLAALISALQPTRSRGRPERTLLACMAVTGLVFVSANTLAPVRILVEEAIGRLTGARISITQDPSDAVAVLAYIPLWIIARRKLLRPGRPPQSRAYLAIALGVLLSLANSAAANYGINCLSSDGRELQASNSTYDEVFTSPDGGLTWVPCEACSATCSAVLEPDEVIQHPDEPALQYRYKAGEYIEQSMDGGSSWSMALELKEVHDAAEALYQLRAAGASAVYSAAPLHGLIEPISGNVVFAMGHDGVLVHVAAADRWQWVSVGQYGRISSPRPTSLQESTELLYGEIHLAILLGLTAVATAMIAEPNRRSKLIAAVLPWGLFILCWAFSPAVNRTTYIFVPLTLLIFAGDLTAALHLLVFSRSRLRLPKVPWLLGIPLSAGIAFLIPYVLWAYRLLPDYSYALALSIALGLGVTAIARRLYQTSR